MNDTAPHVITLSSKKPGKTVAIFAGVHGDEPVGVQLLDEMQKTLKIKQGVLRLVYANPKAIKTGRRQIGQNLNRVFFKNNNFVTYEEKLAKQLMILLDNCDALLDLHAYSQPKGTATPFAIYEENSFDFVKSTTIPFVLSGLHNFEKGSTDQYMYFNQKPAICVELGSKEKPQDFIELGRSVINTYLSHFGLLNETPSPSKVSTTYLQVVEFYKRKHDAFDFTKNYSTFECIPKGETIAVDGGFEYQAKQDSYIIFPRQDAQIGTVAFVLAEKIPF